MPVTTIPSDEDTVLARQASRQLSELNVDDKPLEFQLECSGVMILFRLRRRAFSSRR